MIRPRAAGVALLSFVFCASARAQLYPSFKPGFIPASASAIDERGQEKDLKTLLTGAGPAILLPLFTKCTASCPILVDNLKQGLKNAPKDVAFRVVLFSFDADDSDEDLQGFRHEMELPSDWTLVRAASAGSARSFLDQFNYSFMQRGKQGFVHPNELFVLSGQGRWSATFAGGTIASEDLRKAGLEAVEADHPSVYFRLRRTLYNPISWVIGALGLLLLGAGTALIFRAVGGGTK